MGHIWRKHVPSVPAVLHMPEKTPRARSPIRHSLTAGVRHIFRSTNQSGRWKLPTSSARLRKRCVSEAPSDRGTAFLRDCHCDQKSIFLLYDIDSWSASLSKTPRSSFLHFPKTTSPRLFRALSFSLFSFFLAPLFGFTRPFKISGADHFSPLTLSHWWAHMSRSLILNSLEHHWRTIRQSSSSRVSSQTCRCRTHAPTAKPFWPTVATLPPLMTIRHCICKATVSCLGSDLVHSMARLLYVQSH
ncbi:uncharacterized protein TNCV_2830171 [Trichonephila clavipes]|nr:uncharacterized protein TNCV_2830171 [Trichonephila clavipes]